MTGPERKKATPSREGSHEVDPHAPRSTDGIGRPSPASTGTAADALIDDAAGHPKKSETEAALDRATSDDRSAAD